MQYARGGQIAARGPTLARHGVFSGPQKHSEIFKSESSSNFSVIISAEAIDRDLLLLS